MLNEELMIEGYQTLAKKHEEFAAMAVEIALEVIPEWE